MRDQYTREELKFNKIRCFLTSDLLNRVNRSLFNVDTYVYCYESNYPTGKVDHIHITLLLSRSYKVIMVFRMQAQRVTLP